MGWNWCLGKAKIEVFRRWIKLRNVDDDQIMKRIHNLLDL